MISCYTLLGVRKETTKEKINKSHKYMKNKFCSSKESNQITQILDEADNILSDNKKREKYNKSLNQIEKSKFISKNKEETYTKTIETYKEEYGKVYITKLQFFIIYLKYGIDNILTKIIKTIFVLINFILFFIIKSIIFTIVCLFTILEKYIDWLAGTIMLLAILTLFINHNIDYPDYIPFIPANVEQFCLLAFTAGFIEYIKHIIITGTENIYVLFGNVEENILVKILMK